MKAGVRAKYGPPDIISITEVELPCPKENEVVIRVHASTVNRSDYHVLTGMPFIMRLFKGELLFIRGLIESGSFVPVIDRMYPIEKIAEAFKYVATGQKIGNVILTMRS